MATILVVLTGLPSTEHLGRDAFQEINQNTLFLPVAKRVMTLTRSERLPELILEAFRIAGSGRFGPVVVNIPRDLLNHSIDFEAPLAGRLPAMAGGAVDRATLERVKALLLAAKRPR